MPEGFQVSKVLETSPSTLMHACARYADKHQVSETLETGSGCYSRECCR